MATYIGFSTVDADKSYLTKGTGAAESLRRSKKFKLVDRDLVIQDLVNALNISQGQKPGNPGYGTKIWSFIFEPNTLDVQQKVQDEVFRVASSDPRLIVNTVKTFFNSTGIQVRVELAVAPFNDARVINIFFSSTTNSAIIQ